MTALAAGTAGGLTTSASSAVTDAYGALRARLRQLFGDDEHAVEVLERHEGDPGQYQEPLRLMLVRADAARDDEVLSAARDLLASVASDRPAKEKYHVDVHNSQGVAVGNGVTQHNVFHK
ncbi:hypothetical protein GCM10010424_09470 [Streptomyces lienomycini]